MNIQTGDEAVSRTPSRPTSPCVRVKRDILRRSTHRRDVHQPHRSTSTGRATTRPTASTRRLASSRTSRSAATTRAPRRPASTGDDDSYQGKFDYGADRYGVHVEYLKVGDNFNPEVGFLRAHRLHALVRVGALQPAAEVDRGGAQVHLRRPASSTSRTAPATLETRQADRPLQHRVREQRRVHVEANANYELLVTPFSPAPGHRDSGRRLSLQRRRRCRYNFGAAAPRVGQRRRCSSGEYYDGTIRVADVLAGPLSRSSSSSRSSRASRSTASSCRTARSRRGCSARAPTTASRRACSPARCCSTAPPTTPSAATCASAGNTARAASSSSSRPTSRTPIRSSRSAAASRSGTARSSSR